MGRPRTRDSISIKIKEFRQTWNYPGNRDAPLPELPLEEERGGKKDFQTHFANGKVRCDSWSLMRLRFGARGVDAQCRNSAVVGTKKCKAHSRSLVNKPKTLNQEFSRYKSSLPPNLLKRLIEVESDPDKLSLEAELDMITARLREVFERLDSRQSTLAWKMVEDGYRLLNTSVRSSDVQGIKTGLGMLREALQRSDYPVWHDLVNLIQNRTRLVESQRRSMVEKAEVITLAEMMGVLATVQSIIFDVVTDDMSRATISQRFAALVAPDPHALPPPDDDKTALPKTMGCKICRNDEFRERNKDKATGAFICPECGQIWNADTIAMPITVIEGEVVEVKREREKAATDKREKEEARTKEMEELSAQGYEVSSEQPSEVVERLSEDL